MHIDQWDLAKAMLGGFASVFLNPKIMISFVAGILIVITMKIVFKKLEEKQKNRRK